MVDKIFRKSANEVVIYFTDREQVWIRSDQGNAMELAFEVLGRKPIAVFDADQDEPTQAIELDKIAI